MKADERIMEIYNILKRKIEYNSNGKVIVSDGPLSHFLKTIASLFYAYDKKNEYEHKNISLKTADLEHLIFEFNNFVPFKTATYATGLAYFIGVANTMIPKGTVLKDSDNNKYETVELSQIDRHVVNKTIQLEGDKAFIDVSDLNLGTSKIYINGIEKIGFYEDGKLVFSQNKITEIDGDGNIIPIAGEIVINYAKVNIKRLKAGVSDQRLFDSILTLQEPITGVDREARVLVYVKGEDNEDVDSYRNRILTFLSKSNAPFSKHKMEELIYKNVPAVKFLAIKGGEYEPGKVKIYAINRFYNLDDVTKNEILLRFYNRAPLNIKKEHITCVKPIIKDVNVVISKMNPNTDTMVEAIKKSITDFFEYGNFFEKNIEKIDLERVIFLSQIGVEKVISFELKEGFIGSEADTYFKLGSISIT